jgi:hypothetical protein
MAYFLFKALNRCLTENNIRCLTENNNRRQLLTYQRGRFRGHDYQVVIVAVIGLGASSASRVGFQRLPSYHFHCVKAAA